MRPKNHFISFFDEFVRDARCTRIELIESYRSFAFIVGAGLESKQVLSYYQTSD